MYNQTPSTRLPAPILVALIGLAALAAYQWLPRWIVDLALRAIVHYFGAAAEAALGALLETLP